jgi:triacylglycerol esterase/lipase EstA (alpha/beta hydrolase family)
MVRRVLLRFGSTGQEVWMSRSRRSVVAALSLSLASGVFAGCAVDGDELGAEELAGTVTQSNKDPVLFVHGCPPPGVTHEQVSHFFDPMKQFFLDNGYETSDLFTFVFSGAQCGSNIDFAEEIAQQVRDIRALTNAARVDVVAHSMGALATRLYLYQGGNACIRDFAMIGGANHGGQGAADGVYLQSIFGYPAYEGMKEMFPPYACAGQTSGGAADIQALLNGCLTPTGRTVWADETLEGGVHYLSIRNAQDEIVVPVGSACLDQDYQNDCSDTETNTQVSVPPGPGPCGPDGCPAHVTMLWDPGVMTQVFNHLSPQNLDYDPTGGDLSGYGGGWSICD